MANKKAAAADKPAPPAAPKVTKAQAIRDALKKYRKLLPKEIAEKLSATGLTVSANDVSIYKYQMKAKKGARKAAKAGAPAAATVPVAAPAVGDLISMAALEAAKKLGHSAAGASESAPASD